SHGTPCRAENTTSLTSRYPTKLNTITSSGMMAPASVPQEMIVASFHHCVASPPSAGIMRAEITYVSAIDTSEVIQTSDVKGASKFISFALPYFALAMAPLMKYAKALATSMTMRMTKIQTISC